ncbi:MAG: response regulator transcription factor [Propionibacteriaceae bacterium]|nr:response regulator transcription factor [Propionibacteriaceae bacterium]
MTELKPRALVVDDEAQMVSIVEFALETQGFATVGARSAEEAWRQLGALEFDLVVLDVMLPGASGVQLCERIRTTSDIPVILLTARGEEQDRLRGLMAGADDYVTKPFSPRELALRASAVVRRTRGRRSDTTRLSNGPLTVDQARRQALLDGRVLRLSDVELRLLTVLTRHAGEVVDWRTLLNEVWATAETAGGRDMLKTAIYRLRQQLGPAGEDLIHTVRGAGYLMPARPDEARDEP